MSLGGNFGVWLDETTGGVGAGVVGLQYAGRSAVLLAGESGGESGTSSGRGTAIGTSAVPSISRIRQSRRKRVAAALPRPVAEAAA